MVDVTTQDLARRAVSCKGWKWLPGMRLRSIRAYLRVVGLNGDGALRLSWDDPGRPVEGDTYTVEHIGGALPDLTDPATVGCLLFLVREAWNDHTIAARFSDEHGLWIVDGNRFSGCAFCYDTEAAALVAALENGNG